MHTPPRKPLGGADLEHRRGHGLRDTLGLRELRLELEFDPVAVAKQQGRVRASEPAA